MATALDKIKAKLQGRYGDLSVMTPSDMVDKGVVSSGSLAIDYMVSSKRGFGIPRNIVVEIGGKPGSGKSTLAMNIISNVLDLEFERAKMYVRLERSVKTGAASADDMERFKAAWDRQSDDLHVFDDDSTNMLLDEVELSDSEIDHAIDDVMRNALYCDIEGRFDQHWAANFIDRRWLERKLLVTWPDTIENATTMYVDALRTGTFAVAAIDSIGGAPTVKTFDKEAEKASVGGNAVGVTAFAKYAQNMSNKFTCLTIGLQQVRADMEGFRRYITPGGEGWKHACSLRIELRRSNKEVVYDDDPGAPETQVVCGFKVHARLHKNSVGLSGREVAPWFYTMPCKYGDPGFDRLQDVVNLATLSGVLEKGASGTYRSDILPDGRIRGYDRLIQYLRDNEDVYNSLRSQMEDRLLHGGVEGYVSTFDDSELDD